RWRWLQVAPVLVVCVLAGYVVVRILAAGPAASFLVSNGTVSGNARVENNATALDGRMVVFGVTPTPTPAPTPTPTPAPTATPVAGASSCPLPKYPNASCTGVPSGTSLVTMSGDYHAKTTGEHITAKL